MHSKPPKFQGTAFNCPLCNAFAHMNWQLLHYSDQAWRPSQAFSAICNHCNRHSFWLGTEKDVNGKYVEGRMIYPALQLAALPHLEMPDEIKADFEEARSVAPHSPRAAAALLRLCIQKMCVTLGEPGKNINEDIGALVKKGLPLEIQQALNVVRVVGNNAVHPGAISADDVAVVSSTLFDLVNYIVEDRIARPKKLASMFAALPEPARADIEARDKGKP